MAFLYSTFQSGDFSIGEVHTSNSGSLPRAIFEILIKSGISSSMPILYQQTLENRFSKDGEGFVQAFNAYVGPRVLDVLFDYKIDPDNKGAKLTFFLRKH